MAKTPVGGSQSAFLSLPHADQMKLLSSRSGANAGLRGLNKESHSSPIRRARSAEPPIAASSSLKRSNRGRAITFSGASVPNPFSAKTSHLVPPQAHSGAEEDAAGMSTPLLAFPAFPAAGVNHPNALQTHGNNSAHGLSQTPGALVAGASTGPTIQPVLSSVPPASAPSTTTMPKNKHELQVTFNGYHRLSPWDILYGKNADGTYKVPEDHIFGGVFLKFEAAFSLTAIAEAVNAKKLAVRKRATSKNSYTKRRTAALTAKAAMDAARDGTELNVLEALVDRDVAAGKSREVAEASRKQKAIGNRNGAYGSGGRPATSSSSAAVSSPAASSNAVAVSSLAAMSSTAAVSTPATVSSPATVPTPVAVSSQATMPSPAAASSAVGRPKRKRVTKDTTAEQGGEDTSRPTKRVATSHAGIHDNAELPWYLQNDDGLSFESHDLPQFDPLKHANLADLFPEFYQTASDFTPQSVTTPVQTGVEVPDDLIDLSDGIGEEVEPHPLISEEDVRAFAEANPNAWFSFP